MAEAVETLFQLLPRESLPLVLLLWPTGCLCSQSALTLSRCGLTAGFRLSSHLVPGFPSLQTAFFPSPSPQTLAMHTAGGNILALL